MKHLTHYTTLLKLFLVMWSALFLAGLALLTVPVARGAAENPSAPSPANLAGLADLPGLGIDFKERGPVHAEDLTPRGSANPQPLNLLGDQPSPSDKPGAYLPLTQGTLYTVPIVIDNTGNTSVLTDYQVSIALDTTSLISQGRLRPDCGDMRFYDSTQAIPLPYWLESGCATSSTKVWIKVPTIPAASTERIYLTYGDSSRTSESNGDAVFEFFDDFDGADGSALDSSKWSIDKVNNITASIQGNKYRITDGARSGVDAHWIYDNTDTGSQDQAVYTLPTRFVVDWLSTAEDTLANRMGQGGIALVDASDDQIEAYLGHQDQWGDRIDLWRSWAYALANPFDTFESATSGETKKFSIARDGITVTFYIDETLKAIGTMNGNPIKLAIAVGAFDSYPYLDYVELENLRIRKYTSPEPIATIFSSGSALALDGDDYIDLRNDEIFHLTDETTLEAWIKASAGDYRTILSKGYSTDLAYALRLTRDSQGPQAFFSIRTTNGNISPGYDSSSLNPTLENNSWYHLAGNFDGNQACFYINGQEIECEALTGQILTNTLPIFIGKLSTVYPQTEYFNGLIDDVRIWNKALTQAEIQSTMNVPLVGNEAGLVSYWKFDEGDGQIVGDSTNNNNNGYLGSTSEPDNNDPAWTDGLIPILYPDLHLTVVGTSVAQLGENINYELIVKNNGHITAPNVIITHTLPPGIAFVSGSISPTSQTNQTLTWQLSDLARQESKSLSITGIVSSSTIVGASLVATSTVNSGLAEVNMDNNISLFTSTVVPGPMASLIFTTLNEVDMFIPFSATVTAYDKYGNIATGYTGTMTLTSTDPLSDFPITHQFITTDQGVYTFTNLVLRTAGIQTITATDEILSQTRTLSVDDDVVVDQSTTWRGISINLNSLVVTGTGTVLTLERLPGITVPTVITLTEGITVGNGAFIQADGQGYSEGEGLGAGNYCSWWACANVNGGGSGGGHGNFGGIGVNNDNAGNPYGSVLQPTDPGSGGGGRQYAGAGGTGGGAIKIVATSFINNGEISVNGLNGGTGAGGGSGGSLWIETGTLAGNGIFKANGGAGGGTQAGGGAGGRIAIYYDINDGFIFDSNHIQTWGGSGYQDGGPGTTYLGHVDPLASTIEISPLSIPANGVAGGIVTVTLHTTTGTPVPEYPVSVSLKNGNQSSTYINGQPTSVGAISLGETNADGVATTTITSTSSETKTVEATSGVVRLVNPAMVFFDPDFVSPIASAVSIIGPSTVAANGSELEVQITARDKFGNLVPNIPTTLGTSPEVTLTGVSTITNQLGQATYRISHDQPAHVVISAIVNDLPISNVVTATFEGIDLNVSLSASAAAVTAGYPITYYLAVANNGFLTATNIVVTNTLPTGVEFVSHVGNFTPTQIGNQFVWQVGELGPGQATDSFSLVGTVNLTAPTTLINQVTAMANEAELSLADNIESVSTPVVPPIPLLAVSPTYPTLPVLLGQIGVLTVTIRNPGTGVMTDTQVVAAPTLPSWITVNRTYLENIPPGQAAVFTITANTAEVNTSGHYRDIVTVKADNVDEEYILLDVHVQRPTRDLQLSVTNNTGAVVTGANVTLREDIFVVTEGQFGTQPYYRQGVTDQAGHLTFTGLETGKTYNFDISANNHDLKSGIVTVDDGTGTQAWAEILTGLPRLTVSPGILAFGIARGGLNQQTLILHNPGAVTLTNISLTNPDNIPWVYLSQPVAGTVIPPGGELAVWVNAAPPLTETISRHQDNIEITASNGNSATAALDITLNDGLTRTLCISVQTGLNSPLADGLVRLVDQTGQVVATNGITETMQKTLVQATDSNGHTCFADLKLGQYLATVGRGELKLGEKEIELTPGEGIQEEAITADEPSVIVNWSVTPTLIDDVYTTVMTMTFVPESKPALTLSPRSISLCQSGSNGIVSETVTIHNFFPVAFTLPVLELEALGNVRATITTTSGSAFSVLPDGKTTLPLDDIPPYAHIPLTLYASLAEDPGQCLAGDAGTILLKLSANYVHYTPNYSWYDGASASYPQLTLNQTAAIPLKLRNSGYPTASNLNGTAPAMQNITLSQPQQLTWITITPTNIISLPLQHEAGLTLTVNPPQWLAHGAYYDHVLVKATNGVTAIIGLKAEMSADGLKIETQLVTPLNSNNPDQQASLTRPPGLAYPLTYLPPGQAAGEPQINVWGHLVASQNAEIGEVIDIFGDVWNLQVLNCDCSQPGQPPKQRPTWSWLGNQLVAVKVGDPSPPGSGAAFAPEFKDNLVRLRVSQRYALEREAFNAQLELINGTAAPVNNIEVDITITDEGGAPVLMRQPGDPLTSTQTITPNFPSNSLIPTSTLGINMPSAWQENGDANFIVIPAPPTLLGNLDEAGERQLGSWTIIPDASGITSSTGKNYFVYATIKYNNDKVIVTTREMITIQPQPKILLDYFIPRYVYAGQPGDWQVIATNVGYGPANNFSIGQPTIEILKQSDQYPTSFTVNGQSTLNFVRLEAGQQVVSTWQITADHDGYFRDIEAACLHQNYQGVELPPLIYCKPTIHIIENAPPDDASQWGKDNACTIASWQAFDSDPVNTYSGNFTYSRLDASIPTWGLPLAFERAYNSRDPEDGPLGWGWTHNYNVEMTRESYIPAVTPPLSDTQVLGSGGGDSSPDSSPSFLTRTPARIGKIATPPGLILFGQTQDIMTVRLPHGSRAYFEIQDNGDTFVPFPGVKAELTRQGDVYRLALPQEQTVYVFTLDQKLAYLEDRNGNRLTFAYSDAAVPSEQRLLSVTDPAGRSLSFAYDADKRLISLTDPLSRTMAFGYTNGYLTSVTDFRGQTTTYAYTPPATDPATGERLPGQLATITDANNYTEVTNHYDGKRRVDWQEDAAHHRTTFTYAGDDGAGTVTTTTTDPAGQETIDHYNDKGQLVKQMDTYGFFEVYEYDDTYNMTRLVDKKGRETRYDWNDCGCAYEQVTDPLGYTTRMTYNSQGQLTGITDKRGHVTSMTYDSHANPLTVSDPLAGTVAYSYGSRGELLSKTDENNHSTFYGYDLYGNTTVITDALGQATRMTYDLAGRLLSTTDALGRVTH